MLGICVASCTSVPSMDRTKTYMKLYLPLTIHSYLFTFFPTGERLGSESEYHTGLGTYRRNGFIYASLAGHVCSRTEAETEVR